MRYKNRMGAVRTASILLALVTGGGAAARAGAITYNINFTGTDDGLPVGSFTYDAAVPAFTNFLVQWNGLTFDLTSSANSPFDDGATGPACLGGLTGAAAGFAWMNPGCQTFTVGWRADTTPSGNSIIASFNFVEQDSSPQIGVHQDGEDAIDNDTGARGAFTISPAETTVPEPASFWVLASGLGLMLLVRRSPLRA